MKPRVLWGACAGVFIAANVFYALDRRTRTPDNAGGPVDLVAEMGNDMPYRLHRRMIQRLSQEMGSHPHARRLRVQAQWGGCSVWGKVTLVYDRRATTLQSWAEFHQRGEWFGQLSRADYTGVSRSSITRIAALEAGTQQQQSHFLFADYDFLLGQGCRKVSGVA